MLMLPLCLEGRLAYLIGLSSNGRGREWPASYPRRLRLLGEIFTHALIPRYAREALPRGQLDLAGAFGQARS